MIRLTAYISLTLAVLLGPMGCNMLSKTPREAADIAIRADMKENRKELFAAIKENKPYIALFCPDPSGYMGYLLPWQFDHFFKSYGDKPLVEDKKFVMGGDVCQLKSWNKVSSPSEQKKMAASQELSLINKAGTTCIQIGFTPKTDKFSDCVLRLMEMQSKDTSQTIIQNNTSDSSGILSLLEEQKKQRELEAAIELMKLGSEIMNPPKSSITCKYNELTKTTVCN